MVDSQLMHNALCIGQLSFAQMQAHLCLDSWKLACQHAYWLQFKDKSFHIAFDKGALDALMGEDTDAARVAGGKLLSEVQRVLDSCDGQYLCVTLGQTHVLSERAICTVAVLVAVSVAVSIAQCSIMQKCSTFADCTNSFIGHLLFSTCAPLIHRNIFLCSRLTCLLTHDTLQQRHSHTECYCVYAGKLLSSFGLGWSIAIDRVPPSPDMAKSPLQPLLVTVTRIPQPTSRQETQEWQQEQQQDKVDGQIDDVHSEDGHTCDVVEDKQACTAVPLVHLSFRAEAGVVNSEQLADVIKVHPWCLLHLITQLSAKMPCFRQHLHEHIYSSRPLQTSACNWFLVSVCVIGTNFLLLSGFCT